MLFVEGFTNSDYIYNLYYDIDNSESSIPNYCLPNYCHSQYHLLGHLTTKKYTEKTNHLIINIWSRKGGELQTKNSFG